MTPTRRERFVKKMKVYHPKAPFERPQHMKTEDRFKNTFVVVPNSKRPTDGDLHPAWSVFIKYCSELEHGEIETLEIQNGLPVLAEVARKKIKFAP